MRITVRLYKRHDLDLLSLYYAENYDFKEEFKKALIAYIKGKPIKNKTLPEGINKPIRSLPPKVSFHVDVKNKKDMIIYDFLKGITKGRRNNIMKNIFRNTFPVIVVPYKCESEIQEYNFDRR